MAEEFIDVGNATYINLRHVIALRIANDAEAVITLHKDAEGLLDKGVNRVFIVRDRDVIERLRLVVARSTSANV